MIRAGASRAGPFPCSIRREPGAEAITSGSYVSDDEEWHYYTRDEVKDLVAFCGNLGIEIVPEVDLPGHVSAILAAYPMLSCHGNPVEVQTKSGIFRDILCRERRRPSPFWRSFCPTF